MDKNIGFDNKFTKQQWKVLTTPANEIFFGAGKACGKTYAMRQMALLYAMNVPGIQIYILRESYSAGMGTFVYGSLGFKTILKEYEEAGLCDINISEHTIQFTNGSSIYVKSCRNIQDTEKFRGNDIHVLMCDDTTEWLSKEIYQELRYCLRLTIDIDYDHLKKIGMGFIEPGFFPRVILGANPGGKHHNFIKSEFVDKVKPYSIVQMPIEDGGMLRTWIPAYLEDNTFLTQLNPSYREKLEHAGGIFKNLVNGDWDIGGE